MARRQTRATANTVEARPSLGSSASRRPTRGGLLGATALAALVGWGVLAFTAPASAQLPTGGTVVGGSATITTGTNQVTVNQTTNRGVIDWRSFSIGQGNRVDFQQPGASSVTLNRVTGPDPSVIAGRLTANGQIVLVNGAGVVFANGAQVNVGSLVASTANIANTQAFMADGKLAFDVRSPNANAGVVNDGSITVRDGGLVGLVGNTAANNGVINARLGRVTIGGAETFTVDLAGDGLINFQVGQPVSRQPVDDKGRKQPLASNTGTINADGGVVQMTARAAGSVVDSVVNVGGAIRAQAVTQENGVLVLGAVTADAGNGGTVNVTGKIDVSGRTMGQRGGQVVATTQGGKVNVAATAVIDASGALGGGKVNIGGSYQGKGPIANARDTTVAAGAQINADATMLGNGGQVIVWADNATVFGGMISARGGLKGGDGGFVETSGKIDLSVLPGSSVSASAVAGRAGTWLLDPRDVNIVSGGAGPITTPNDPGPSGSAHTIDPAVIAAALNGGSNVEITTNATGIAPFNNGDITVSNAITWTTANTLTFNADRSIFVNASITGANTAAGTRLILNAGVTSAAGGISSGTGAAIDVGGGTLVLTAAGSITLSNSPVTAGLVDFQAGSSMIATNAGNSISAIRGSVGGSINISTTGAMTVDTAGISAGNGITLQSDGDLTVNGPVETATGALQNVSLVAGGQLTLNASVSSGSASGSLFLQSTGASVAIASAGSASSQLNVNVTANNGDILVAGSISASNNVNMTADGQIALSGTISATNTVTMTADGSVAGIGILQSGGQIIANLLNVTANAGEVQLTSPANDVAAIIGSAATNFRYVDSNDLTLGDVLLPGTSSFLVRGITIGTGGYLDIAASAISIAAETVFVPYQPAKLGIVASGAANPTGVTVLRPTEAGGSMTIGGPGTAGLSEAALFGAIQTGTLRIGSVGRTAGTLLGGATTAGESAAGAITIQGLDLFGSAVATLVLESGTGSITQTGAVAVSALATSVVGGGSVVLTNENNDVGTIAHIARVSDTTLGTQTGSYQYVGFGTVTVAATGKASSALVGLRGSGETPGLPANAAIVTSGGNVSLTSTSSAATININAPLVAIGAVVTLNEVIGGINNNASGTIDVGSTGTLNLIAATSVDLGDAPVIAGTVNFTAPNGSVFLDNPGNVIGTIAQTLSKSGPTFIFSSTSLTIGPGGITSSAPVLIESAGRVLVTGSITSTDTTGSVTISSTGAIDGVGILQTGGTISAPIVELEATAGDIRQQNGANIVATSKGFTPSLTATASGSVDLSSATNDVVTLVGAAGGDFRYVDANAVSIGQAFTVPIGITIGAGRYLEISADVINILAGARIGGIATGSPGSSFPADNPTGVTVLRPTTANAAMVVGGTTGTTGTLLTEANLLASVQTGTLRLGSIGRAAGLQLGGAITTLENPTGTITVQGLNFSGAGQLLQRLVLESGAAGLAIQQTGAIRLTRGGGFEGALATAVRGSGSVELTNPNNSVTGLAHVARESDTTLGTQTGTFRYVDESSIPVVSVAGPGTPLIGDRNSGTAPGAPANSAILTNGGDVTLVSRTGSIEFINGLAAIGATARLNAAADIFQSALGGVVVNSLLAVAGGAVDLSTAVGLNNVRFLSGSAAGGSGGLGDFRLINAASVTVQGGGVAGDSLVATVDGVHAGVGATLELAIASGDIVVNNTTLTTTDGLVLLRRVAGATGSEIVLNNVSFDSGSGSPNLVVLDLTGSPGLLSGSFATLKSSATPPSGTSAIPLGPNPDGGILLTNVNAGNTTVYLVGGTGSTIAGSGTYGLLGVYVAHSNPIALTGSVRQIDPTAPHSVAAPFSEPFDSTTFAGFYVRRRGAVVDVQTFNDCPIGSGICPTPPEPPENEVHVPDRLQHPPDQPGTLVGTPDVLVIDFATDRPVPTPLGLSTVILVNQGNEYFFNVDEERRKQRAARGGQ